MKILIPLILAVLIAGCIGQGSPDESGIILDPVQECIALCQAELSSGKDLSAGPCLSNDLAPGWVCDVANSPRRDMDNLPENQCSGYREGKASHFVEVDLDCKLIKSR